MNEHPTPVDPIDWLLEPSNPSARYLTLRRLLERPDGDAEVAAARAAIHTSPLAARLFRGQGGGGYWGDPASPYLPKYKASYWTVMLLGHLGFGREDERVRRAVDYVCRFQQPGGGFPETGREGALARHARTVERCRTRGRQPPAQDAFVEDQLQQATLSCLTGKMAAALLRLGYGRDPRVWRALEWLAGIQNADGGWLCPYWRAHVRDRHGCFMGTIAALEAFSEVPAAHRPASVRAAAGRGAEFLLQHRLYRADHHGYGVIHPYWLELSFPWLGYDILYALAVLTRLGCADERMADALEVLRAKRTPEGRWLLESTPQGRLQATPEVRGRPSKFVTLHALWVLEHAAVGPASRS